MLCMERFDRSYETHVDLDPRGELLKLRDGERVSDYILRHIHDGRLFVGCEGTEPLISEALRLTGGKCFVFSSDFPHEVNADICKHELSEIFENTKITGEERTGGAVGERPRALRASRRRRPHRQLATCVAPEVGGVSFPLDGGRSGWG